MSWNGSATGLRKVIPACRCRLYFDSGLDLRQTIAGMENSMVGQYFIGSGPINLIAPGGDELISRLEQSITCCRIRSGPMRWISWSWSFRNRWLRRRSLSKT